jgi:hypothetical protein
MIWTLAILGFNHGFLHSLRGYYLETGHGQLSSSEDFFALSHVTVND